MDTVTQVENVVTINVATLHLASGAAIVLPPLIVVNFVIVTSFIA